MPMLIMRELGQAYPAAPVNRQKRLDFLDEFVLRPMPD
jgi:hypothetical protein